jgi:hypothetical protein
MDLKQKFFAVSAGKIIIMDLDIGVRYPIAYAVQMVSSVLLTLNVNGDANVKVYLPQRYVAVCNRGHI